MSKGYFVAPTVFTDVRPDMKILREEIFGPVVCAIPVQGVRTRSPPPATTPPTASPPRCGRATSRRRTAWPRASRRAPSGSTATTSSTPPSPFGGYKQSGFGREMGKAALELYTQIKSVWVNLGAHDSNGQ